VKVHAGAVGHAGERDHTAVRAGVLGEHLGDDERRAAERERDGVVGRREYLDLVAEPLHLLGRRVRRHGALERHALALPRRLVRQRLSNTHVGYQYILNQYILC